MIRFRSFLLVLAIAATLTTSSCGDEGDAAEGASTEVAGSAWPQLLREFRFHWTASPGVDLLTGPAVPIRAYLESYYVASSTLNLGDVYPGFIRATPENDQLDGHYLAQLARIRPLNGVNSSPDEAIPRFGYMPMHILSISPIGNGLRAIVCQGNYATYIRSTTQPNKYVSISAEPKTARTDGSDPGIVVHRIELTDQDPRTAQAPPSTGSQPQRGPSPAPHGDVFGKWFFTGSSTSYWGPIDAPVPELFPSPELREQCGDTMPEPAATRLEMMNGFKNHPARPGIPTPGWPAKPE
ncbi:hypothetical protein NIIDNTM18_48050 [Mycolicibacterium litorale]|uniref:Lipoprotein n=1 Tax=Mycolicibacterium litorale TaxID=758802 RepID=A0A6S6PCZ5_9MYCO|nr:hypothetical protein NIIDNTM18_48050 [Mycolicibacterium litorale]